MKNTYLFLGCTFAVIAGYYALPYMLEFTPIRPMVWITAMFLRSVPPETVILILVALGVVIFTIAEVRFFAGRAHGIRLWGDEKDDRMD